MLSKEFRMFYTCCTRTFLKYRCIVTLISASVIGKNIITQTEHSKYEDKDEPLFLTPLIEKHQTEEARKLSEVDPTLFAGVKSYAAYITVNKTYNSNTFFWYFPAAEPAANVEDTPWLIWLQGGPGGSSMYGLFTEIGPLEVVDGKAQKMTVTWGSNYSLLFIDNPVGTGFSFADEDGYATDEDMVGSALLNFLQQFLQVFPELRKAPLFLSGESYAGKYIPAFGHYIHSNKNESLPINLKGCAIGDGWTDPRTLTFNADFALEVGLISPEQSKEIDDHETKARKSYDDGDFDNFVKEASISTNLLDTFAPVDVYNYLKEKSDENILDVDFIVFLNREDVQKALHVGHVDYTPLNYKVYSYLQNDIYHSVKPWLEELIEHYHVLCYKKMVVSPTHNIEYYSYFARSGQLDVIVAYALSVHTHRSLKWSRVDEYLNDERKPLRDTKDENKINAFVKQGGNFMDVMVRGAGHMVPSDKPEETKQLIDYFIQTALKI